MMRHIFFFVLAYLICLNITYSKNNFNEKQIVAERLHETVNVDGILSESIWQHAGFTGMIQQDPDQDQSPSQRCEIWFAYDNEAIYFAGKYYDNNPDSIMARLVRRDFIWGDPSDGCVVYFDPYDDHRNGYFFYVSAAGTLADGIIENDVKQPNDLSWDAVWEGVSHLDVDGWSIEMKIPYSQLRFKEGLQQVWGVNVERYISRRNETDMIAFTPRNESGFASRFWHLIGIEGITPPTRLETMPYVTGRSERIGGNPEDPFNRMERYLPGAGVDVKAGLSSSLTLNGTINPDFCQVEVDPANLNLTDIETLYEEKRPFFTEGVGIFRFGQGGTNNIVNFGWTDPNIFYSRRIGRTPQRSIDSDDPTNNYYVDIPTSTRILGAGKISGTLGDDWKVGMIHALTNREKADVNDQGQRSQIEIEPLTYYGVIRAQRDFNNSAQGFGILSTYTQRKYDDTALRDYTNSDALVVASDGWTYLDSERTYVLSGWAAISRISGNSNRMNSVQQSAGHYFQRPDASHLSLDTAATSMTGYAGRFMVNKNRGRWVFNTAVGFISPKFEANDLGSIAYSDFLDAHFFTSYRWNVPTKYYQFAGVNGAVMSSYDFGGNLTAQGLFIGTYVTLPIYYGGNINFTYYPETYNARLTRGGPLTLNPISRKVACNLFTDNREWWVVNLGGSLKYGDALWTRTVYAYVEVKATSTLTLSIGPTFIKEVNQAQYYKVVNDLSATETFSKKYLFARLDRYTLTTDIRADWILSPKLSFQVYLQPYITSGKYTDYRSLTRPKKFLFTPYNYTGNRDFDFISFQGNAVLRWEYLPGSTLYLVWTQSRMNDQYNGGFEVGKSIDRMFEVKPDNILMLKVSYWLGM